MSATPDRATLEGYAPLVGEGTIRDIRILAENLRGCRVQHVNSTLLGGGVAELLQRLVPLMREVGLDVEWTVMEGSEEFFKVTKQFHDALHGKHARLTPESRQIYQDVIQKNVPKLNPNADVIVLHDPQPLGLAEYRNDFSAQFVWRCHIDISRSDPATWFFLHRYVNRCNGAVYHLPEYSRDLAIEQFVMAPAIDPFAPKNCELSSEEVGVVLEKFGIDPHRPLVVQVSRFDALKDPVGVIEGYRLLKRWSDCQLVLAGAASVDDPDGQKVLAEVEEKRAGDPDVFVLNLPADSHRQINALQRAADVIVQKSLGEGFGLVVTEAMWKARPVIGGNVGGIRRQIVSGATGILVDTVEGFAYQARTLLGNRELADRLGTLAREQVRVNFLIPHYLKRWLLILLAIRHPGKRAVDLGRD